MKDTMDSTSHYWRKSYPKGIPFEINTDGASSIGEVFEQACAKYGKLNAFTCMGSSISYAELEARSRDFGAFLQASGLAKGDRVALMMPNLVQYPIALFGILRAGLVVVNVNPLYTPRELEHQLHDSGAKALVIVENFAKTFEQVSASFPGMRVITTQVGDMMPAPKRWLVNTVAKRVKKMVPEFNLPSASNFRQTLANGARLALAQASATQDDLAFLQYTGGTTGVAKGAMLTHRNIIANMRQSGAWISTNFTEGKEVAVSPLPLYHIFCLTSMLTFLTWGARNILVPNPRDLKGLVALLCDEPWTILTGVNTLFNGLVNTAGLDKADFARVKVVVGGGSAVQRPVAEAWRRIAHIDITEAYGLTETSPGVAINPIGEKFRGSLGLPIPSTEISIRTDDFKKLAPWNGTDPREEHTGEICIRGPQVMKGYWMRDDETQKVMRDGWFLSGDLGHMDMDGFVYITDRKKDMILVSGFNVYPNEIEEVLSGCPGVLECAAIGVPDAKTGEAVKVFVVRKNPALTEADIIAYCKKELTGYKMPRQIEFRDSLPKTPVGKILRRELAPKKT
jgi:long-chain acyl-CoA synthetase